MHDRDDAEERAKRRADWPVRRARLDAEEQSDHTSAEDRLRMMWQLAVDAWVFAGREIPDYSREETPVSLMRRDER